MKKITIMAIAACVSVFGTAATYSENAALAATPTNMITEANAGSIVDACIAITNRYYKIEYCINKNYISRQQFDSKIAGISGYEIWQGDNALKSGDSALINAAFDRLISVCISTVDNNQRFRLMYSVHNLRNCDCVPASKIIQAGQDLMNAGRTVEAISLLYYVNWKIFMAPDGKYDQTYVDFLRNNADTLYDAWLRIPPAEEKNKIYSLFFDGCVIIRYKKIIDGQWPSDGIEKLSLYYKNGIAFNDIAFSPVFDICRQAYISSPYGEEKRKIKYARALDTSAGNKNATEQLYAGLTTVSNKVNAALYLNDMDKLIDVLKTVDDSLDAKTVESVIAPLNGVNAGYRTADLRLALMNINKKYTLKLYDDRDAWEPILSKIRAMIDAL